MKKTSVRFHILITVVLCILSAVITTSVCFCDEISSQGAKAVPPRYLINDAHMHYVNFVQESDGIDVLLKSMNSLGVEHTMLNGVTVTKQWDAASPVRPLYYLSDDSRAYWYSVTDIIVARAVLSLPEKERYRFHPYICGFNPTDRNAIDHVKRMIEWYPDFWEGIGEIFLRHNALSAYTYGGPSRADNIALDPIYDLAAELDLPVVLHSDIGSQWLHDPIYLEELENAIKKHPRTKFQWAHAGIARDIKINGLTGICAGLLARYPNVWIDLSSHLYEEYLAIDGKFNNEWAELIERYPDRFMVGADVVGNFRERYQEHITRNYIILDALKPETVEKVARTNFINILPQRVRDRLKSNDSKR
ncbi:MAG: amidohydrolase family protein [Vulcanimicrobiota bacterium]